MKCFVDISMHHTGGIRKGNGTAAVKLSTEMKGELHVKEYIVSVVEESTMSLAVKAVAEALKHFRKPGQEIIIRMEDKYVSGCWQYLEAWHAANYRTKAGKALKNETEWRLIWMAAQQHRISFEVPHGTV